MARVRMHDDEVETDVALTRRLLAGQFPQWAGLPVEPVESSGTDHDIYRVGTELSVRLPRIGWATAQAAKERRWLPVFAPQLPLQVPVQVGSGRPALGYPYDWSVYEWLPGRSADRGLGDLEQAALDLADFVHALRGIDTADAPPRAVGSRGGPLDDSDTAVRAAVAALGERVDGERVLRSWERSVQAPAWSGTQVWTHGDLLPGNLLVRYDRLTAVIDFGGLTVGDPAVDLLPAWNLFDATSRSRFRAELDVDEASWLRGRGWALAQAVIALPYYWNTNPGIVRQASRALAAVLADG